jgi:hypothetical protein
VFLTPHVIRSRTDLRALALDERQQFLDSLGSKDAEAMPLAQVRELYNPSFSSAVPPQMNLNTQSFSAPSNIRELKPLQ